MFFGIASSLFGDSLGLVVQWACRQITMESVQVLLNKCLPSLVAYLAHTWGPEMLIIEGSYMLRDELMMWDGGMPREGGDALPLWPYYMCAA